MCIDVRGAFSCPQFYTDPDSCCSARWTSSEKNKDCQFSPKRSWKDKDKSCAGLPQEPASGIFWFMFQSVKNWAWNNWLKLLWGLMGMGGGVIQDFISCSKLTDATSIQSSSLCVCFSGYAIGPFKRNSCLTAPVLGSWQCCPYHQPCWPLRSSCTGALLFALMGCWDALSDPFLHLPFLHVTMMIPDSMGLLAFCNCWYSFIWRWHLDMSCVLGWLCAEPSQCCVLHSMAPLRTSPMSFSSVLSCLLALDSVMLWVNLELHVFLSSVPHQ